MTHSPSRLPAFLLFLLFASLAPSTSLAEAPAAGSAAVQPAAAVNAAALAKGAVVVAVDGATDAAWPLARSVYGASGLRPAALSDETARVLAGEAPKEGASAKVRDLAELRAAVHGDDAPSRRLLGSIAREVGASAAIVVFPNATCRVFVVESGAFDPTTLGSEADANGQRTWNGATAWLTSRAPSPKKAPEKQESGSILASGWFWGAVVVAGVLGAGAYALSKQSDSSSPSTGIPLQLRIQK